MFTRVHHQILPLAIWIHLISVHLIHNDLSSHFCACFLQVTGLAWTSLSFDIQCVISSDFYLRMQCRPHGQATDRWLCHPGSRFHHNMQPSNSHCCQMQGTGADPLLLTPVLYCRYFFFTLVELLYRWTYVLKMKAMQFSGMLVSVSYTLYCHIPEDCILGFWTSVEISD